MAPALIHGSDKALVNSPNAPDIKASPPKGRPFNKPKHADKPVKATQPPSVPLRSGKPIIDWLQRKLAGSGRAKRATADTTALPKGRVNPRGTSRIVSSPVPSPSSPVDGSLDRAPPIRRTVSLTEDDPQDNSIIGGSDDHYSLARDSTWSPGSIQEADEDASLRPLPPSVPPSPSPSTSSYVSDPPTFRSVAASTKPTTVLSVDMNGNGMAHIAQAPMTPPTQYRFPPHVRTSSTATNYTTGASVTFSALPQSSRPSSAAFGSSVPTNSTLVMSGIQAPLHTAHHPRNNPRPSSPPMDNASVLTLASSAYAIPGLRPQFGHSTTPSTRGLGDSLSHFGGSVRHPDAESTSQFLLGDDDRLDERDVDASVRALRPRSSRRGSWESEASRWSARDQLGGASLARDRSLRTTLSLKIGALSTENQEPFDQLDKEDDNTSLHLSVPDSVSANDVFETPVDAAKQGSDLHLHLESEKHHISTDQETSVVTGDKKEADEVKDLNQTSNIAH